MISRRIILGSPGGAASFVSSDVLASKNPSLQSAFLEQTPQTAGHLTAVFIGRLQGLGWVEGKNLEIRYAGPPGKRVGNPSNPRERMPLKPFVGVERIRGDGTTEPASRMDAYRLAKRLLPTGIRRWD